MRRVGLWALWVPLLAGCGTSGLSQVAATQSQYLLELERTMPAVVSAHDLALRGVLARAQEAEEQALAGEQAESIAEVIDSAVGGAHLNLQNPTRDAVRETLERLMKYHRDQLALSHAARMAREAKARAVVDGVSRLNAALPALVAHQQTITTYLQAGRGLLPLGGVSIAERPENIEEVLARLKAIGRTLDEQFARAQEIFEAARKAAAGGARP